jgi:hypothetical protein
MLQFYLGFIPLVLSHRRPVDWPVVPRQTAIGRPGRRKNLPRSACADLEPSGVAWLVTLWTWYA